MKAVKKGITIFVSVVLWGIILLAALFAFTTLATRDTTKVANLAGFTPMVVESDSMAPTFRAGDLIVIQTCDTARLEEGDIVTFHAIIQNEYALNTHRIVKIEEANGMRSYTTKGDNNEIADTHLISDGDIVGKYVARLPGFGYVVDFLSSSIGFLVVIVLPLLVFFIYQIYNLIMVSVKLKKTLAVEEVTAKAMASSTEDEDSEAILAEAKRKQEEAQAALEEARRLKAEAEAKLAEAAAKEDGDNKS